MPTIGILAADLVDEPLRRHFGDYSEMISTLFGRSGTEPFKFHTFAVYEQEYPRAIDDCDAYVISGSRKSCYDPDSWIARLIEYVKELHTQQKKTIGICFGHQCMALALGGDVAKSYKGWGVGVHEYLVVDRDSFPFVESTRLRLQCSHQDQVTRLPNDAIRTLQSDFCPNAGMRIDDHFLSVQPHPEFSAHYAECLLRSREDKLGPRFSLALDSLSTPTDEIAIAKSFSTFLDS